MIGKVMIGKSFRGCLLYCLHDKQMQGQQAAMKDRAEVLLYHKCYGSDRELIQQFGEVRLLNQRVEKPVLHITLSMAPGEHLEKDKLLAIAEACAREMGFGSNQYIAVLHKDTDHQHLHLVANRIGFDGRTVSDSNSYKKMALLCRKMEQQHSLEQVLSPRRFLFEEERELPRLNHRKERLKEHIKQSLATSKSYVEFEARMKGLGYQVLKARGIAFLDNKGVKTKGSEVGYSLMRLERVLELKQAMEQKAKGVIAVHSGSVKMDTGNNPDNTQQVLKPEASKGPHSEKGMGKSLELLLAPEQQPEAINPALLKKKRKRQKPSL